MARTRGGGLQPNGQTRPSASVRRRDRGTPDASLAEGFP